MFMMKLCMERCLECTMFALFLSGSLIHSMMYLLRSMILSPMDMSLFFMLALNPQDVCPYPVKRSSEGGPRKSICLMYPLSAKAAFRRVLWRRLSTRLSLSSFAPVRQKVGLSAVIAQKVQLDTIPSSLAVRRQALNTPCWHSGAGLPWQHGYHRGVHKTDAAAFA